MKTSVGFQEGHIWYSVFSGSARSNFTRVQRVSCCFSLLLCTMLTSIMFWGVPKDPAEQKMDLGNSCCHDGQARGWRTSVFSACHATMIQRFIRAQSCRLGWPPTWVILASSLPGSS